MVLEANFVKALTGIIIGDKVEENYKGLRIMADPNLHSMVDSIITKLKNESQLEKPYIILDISAGQGAFSKRLNDEGFLVEAVDINEQDFKYSETIKFYSIDLNSYDEWKKFVADHINRYSIIVSIETIEHLENPWSFLRGLKELVKKDGYIILTTPNVENPISKIMFLLKNKFWLFANEDVMPGGHVNPLTTFEITIICKMIGLTIEEICPGGMYPVIWIYKSIRRTIWWSVTNTLGFIFAHRDSLSTCKIYLMHK